MTYTGDNGSSGNENEIQYNKNGIATSDPNLIWTQSDSSLYVTGKIEQKVSNLNLVDKYNLGTVSGLYFQGGNLFVSSGNKILKIDDKGNKLGEGIVSNTPNEIINDGVSIYTITTTTNTLSILDQNLNTTNIITDPINLNGPTRFVIYGKFIFIACGTKLSRFNTASKSIDNTVDIENDAFVDIAIKGDTIVCLRQTSISEINPDTLQIIKNIPSSNIENPRRLQATRDNVFALMSDTILSFDNSLKYIGKSTSVLSNARTISLYGSFIIVSDNAGSISVFDSSNIPATLIKSTTVQVSPNNFANSIVVGNTYYLADTLSENLLHYTLDGIIAGGIKAGSAQITNIETSVLSSETITTKNFSTQNFYTSGTVDGSIGTFGDITVGGGAITGSNIQINSGTQSLVMDAEGFKYINNSEEVVKFKNNGTFQSDSIETNVFKISNGTNKFQISASPLLTDDQILVFPEDNGDFGDVLSTDGDGNLLWRPIASGGSGGGSITIPGGFSSQVQFNDGGIFTASSKFKWSGTHVQLGDNNEISLGHDNETDITNISLGVNNEITFSLDTTNGSQLKFVDSSDVVKILAKYNDTDGASLLVGNVTVSETTVTGVANPVVNNDVANKFYVDTIASSSSNSSYWKNPVRVATVFDIPVFPPVDGIDTVSIIDTVTIAVNDRVLVKDQTDQTQNGLYIVTADTWVRTDDLEDGSNSKGITVRVIDGYKNISSTWNCISGMITGTHSLLFEKTCLSTGISWKESVKCATTTEIATFPPIDGIDTVSTIDSITLVLGDRVLVKDQSDQTTNGIYVVLSETWERSFDLDVESTAAGCALWINQGVTYGDQGWACVSDIGVVGTDNLVFDIMSAETTPGGIDTQIQFNSNGIFGGSSGLTWDGSNINVNGSVTANTSLILKDDSNSNSVTLKAPATIGSDFVLSLPADTGTTNQVLSTGSTPGNLTWVTNPSPYGDLNSIQINDGSGNFISNTSFKIDNSILKIGANQFHISYSGVGDTGGLLNNANDKDFTFRTNQNSKYVFQDYTATEIANISDTGNISVNGVVLKDDDNSNTVTLKAPSVIPTDYIITLPDSDGDANQVLETDGSGVLSWVDQSVTLPMGGENAIQINKPDGTFSGSQDFTFDPDTSSFKQSSNSDPEFISSVVMDSGTKCSAVVVQGNLAYVTNKENFRIYNITDKINITQLSVVTDSSSNLKDIVVNNNLAYIASNTEGSLRVYDVSVPTSTPILMSTVTSLTGAFAVAIKNNIVYVSHGTSISAIDVSNPTGARSIGSVTLGGDTRFIKVHENYLLVAVYTGSNGFQIVDIADPGNMSIKQSLPTGSGWGVDTSHNGHYAFVSRISGNIRVYDLRDIENANVSEEVSFVNVDAQLTDSRKINVSGHHLYVACESADKITRVDISDPLDPQYKGFYYNVTNIDQPVGLYADGNYLYVAASLSNNLVALNTGGGFLDSIEVPLIKSSNVSVDTLSTSKDLVVGKDLIVTGDSFTSILNSKAVATESVESKTHLTGNIEYETKGFTKLSEVTGLTTKTTGVYIENDIAYCVVGNTGGTITAIDVSDVNNITVYAPPKIVLAEAGVLRANCAVKNGYVFVAGAGGDELQVFDATDPTDINATPITSLGPDNTKFHNIRTMSITDDLNTLVLISSADNGGTKGITTVDITDPSSPVISDSIEITASGTGYGSCIGNGFAFSIMSTISAVDISTPGSLGSIVQPTPSITTTSCRYSLVVDNYLYVLRDGQGVVIVDVSTPSVASSMVVVGSCIDNNIFTEVFEMVIIGNTIYVLNQKQGGGSANVIMVDITDKTTPVVIKTIEDPNISWTNAENFPFVRPAFRYHNDAFLYFNEETDSLMTLDTGKLTFPKAVLDKVVSDTVSTNNLYISDKGDATQTTDVNTPVSINNSAGKITTVSLVIASHETESFTVNNSLCKSSSIVMCNVLNYAGTFNLHVGINNVQTGSFEIVLTNSSGGSLDAPATLAFFII